MPTDHEWQRQLADLSDAVYDPQQQTVGDWTRLTDDELRAAEIDPDLLIDDDSGLKSGLYKNRHGDIVGTEARQAGWAGFKGHSAPKSPTNEGRELNHATQTIRVIPFYPILTGVPTIYLKFWTFPHG